MSTLALITMLTVQITVSIITAWFLIKTMRKSNNRRSAKSDQTYTKL